MDLYRNLYSDNYSPYSTLHLQYNEDEHQIPPIIRNEILKSIHSQKNGKSQGENGISKEILKGTSHII